LAAVAALAVGCAGAPQAPPSVQGPSTTTAPGQPLVHPLPDPTPSGWGLTITEFATLPESKPNPPVDTGDNLDRRNRINYLGEIPDGLRDLPPHLDADRIAPLGMIEHDPPDPGIVTVYDVGDTDGISWIAMEWVDGRTLRQTLSGGPLAIRDAFSIAKQMAEGARRVLGADVTIAATGVAGPDEMDDQPVGTVFYGIAVPGVPTEAVSARLPGDRERIRQFATISVLNLLRMRLLALP